VGVRSSGTSAPSIRLQDVTPLETVIFIVDAVKTTFFTFHYSFIHIHLLFKIFIFFALSIIYYILTVKPVYVSAPNTRLWSMRWGAEYKRDDCTSSQFFRGLERSRVPSEAGGRCLFVQDAYLSSGSMEPKVINNRDIFVVKLGDLFSYFVEILYLITHNRHPSNVDQAVTLLTGDGNSPGLNLVR
jgi:hypothetical protein